MAAATRILLICMIALVAASHPLVYNGRNHFEMTVGYPNPMFHFFQDHSRSTTHPAPFISEEITTVKNVLRNENKKVVIESPIRFPSDGSSSTETTNKDEDNFINDLRINKPSSSTDKIKDLTANTLSIHDVTEKPEPILSIKLPENNTKENLEDIEVVTKSFNVTDKIKDERETKEKELQNESNDKEDPGLDKKTDLLIIPVNAINLSPATSVPVSTANIVTPLVNAETNLNVNPVPYSINQNVQPIMTSNLNAQGIKPNIFSTGTVNNNGDGQPTLYSLVNVPNSNIYQGLNSGANNNNMYYVVNNPNQMNSGLGTYPTQTFTLVPVQNLPNNVMIQPNNIAYSNNLNNNYVPYNPGNNLMPNNNQPNNFVPINNNYVPNNNVQPNYVPVNSGSNTNMPFNNVPNGFVSVSNGQNSYTPINNVPNSLTPVNDGRNNFIPVNNGQSNLVPINNVPNSAVPINNNGQNNFVPNNYVPVINAPNNFVSKNNLPMNTGFSFVPYNNQPNYNQPNNFPANNVPYNIIKNNNNMNNNFVPWNNSPVNIVPNNYVSDSNQNYNNGINSNSGQNLNNNGPNYVPNHYIPVNNAVNNYMPVTSVPNNYIPINTAPNNNYVPVSNAPNNYVPVINSANNYSPVNSVNNVPTVTNQPNAFVAVDNGFNNFSPVNNEPKTFVTYNEQQLNIPSNNNTVAQQPIGVLFNFKDEEEEKDEGIDV